MRNIIVKALIFSALTLVGCATSRSIETVQSAADKNGGDLPESKTYLNDQGEELSVSIKTLQSQIFEQNQEMFRLQQQIQEEKIKNANLVQESTVLKARAGVKARRDTATVRGWKPNGDPVIEHTAVEEQ